MIDSGNLNHFFENNRASLYGSSHYIGEVISNRNIVKKSKSVLSVVEKKKEQKSYHPANRDLSLKNEIEHEIECPRCRDVMTLQSDFDRFCYLCEECRFTLSLIN